ncbi:MAG: prephenate dehydratase [Actinomycetales bacterium]
MADPATSSDLRYGYFGPRGTFSEMALATVPGAGLAQAEAISTVDAALAAVRSGSVDAVMVPIENSVEGGVTATLDALATGEPLVILREALVPITFVLAARAGVRVEDVRRVGSHPHAWAQCRGWAARTLPQAVYVPTLSTASAAAGLADGAEERASYDAALCAPIAADINRLSVLAHDVGDNPSAVTRFVLVARPGPVPAPTGADKTTLVAYQTDDHPGGLVEMLEQFAVRGVNLTRLESRPTGDALGQYCFSIDCEGHIAEARVGEALMGLHRTCARVTFLGSYPRAVAPGRVNGSTSPSRRPGTSEADFTAAHEWIAKLRAGGA